MSREERRGRKLFEGMRRTAIGDSAQSFSDTLPTKEQVREEMERTLHVRRRMLTVRNTLCTLAVVAAFAVLVSVLLMPVLRIYGSSMNPTLTQGDIAVAVRSSEFKQGDLICFYYGNKLLVKRYIAGSGQWVDIDEAGNVRVDGNLLEEPYLPEKAQGECDIEFPYQVPDGKIFVLGDSRSTSLDSRSASVGCVSDEQLVGKLVLRIWPLTEFGIIK